jgi:hypothetical protein
VRRAVWRGLTIPDTRSHRSCGRGSDMARCATCQGELRDGYCRRCGQGAGIPAGTGERRVDDKDMARAALSPWPSRSVRSREADPLGPPTSIGRASQREGPAPPPPP